MPSDIPVMTDEEMDAVVPAYLDPDEPCGPAGHSAWERLGHTQRRYEEMRARHSNLGWGIPRDHCAECVSPGRCERATAEEVEPVPDLRPRRNGGSWAALMGRIDNLTEEGPA